MNKTTNVDSFVKKTIAHYLGISDEDVQNDFYLKDDLHMGSGDISDLIHIVNAKYPIDPSAIPNIETVQDLIDILSESEEF